MKLTKEEKEVLMHTLGLNYKDKSFRNHFCASKGHSDYPILIALVEKGYMYKMSNFAGDYFCCIDAVKSHLEKSKPKLTRYQLYLECDCAESYGEWLKSPYWDECRRRNKVS